MKKNISILDKIRNEIKLSRKNQKEEKDFIVEKYIKRNRSFSPLIKVKNLDDSFEFKKYVYNQFSNINTTLGNLTDSMYDVKNDIRQMKKDIAKLSNNNDYSLMISGLNKGIFRNDLKAKRIISDYMNSLVDKYDNNKKGRAPNISNALKKKDRKNNEKNKDNSFIQTSFNMILPKKKNIFNANINLKKKINSNYININRRNIGNKNVSANIKNRTPFDIFESNSQSLNHSIRSGKSNNFEKIIHLDYNLQKAGVLNAQYSERLEKKNIKYSEKNEKKTYRRKNIMAPKINKKENKADILYYKFNQQQNDSNNSNNNPFKLTYSKDSSSSQGNGKKK